MQTIDRFGVLAVMGRTQLYAGEMQRMRTVENIVRAYESRAAYRDKNGNVNWAEWSSQNPKLEAILVMAMEAANGES